MLAPSPREATRPLYMRGMFGLGDNIFSIAVLREVMKTRPVSLEARQGAMFHDLASKGLDLRVLGPRFKEAGKYGLECGRRRVACQSVAYAPETIHEHGSILAAQFASVGLEMPSEPDFTFPIPQKWLDRADKLIATWPVNGRPIAIYRPIVLNRTWLRPNRSPDPVAYSALFAPVRERCFTVSIANLSAGREWITPPIEEVDVSFHHGELDFELMAALWARADLAFCNAGFAPVLSQAVRTPTVIVYGGNECFQTTNEVGAHLAPTLAIEPDRPCACHNPKHACDKRISLEPARRRLMHFMDEVLQKPKVLIFGTCYIDSEHRAEVLKLWAKLHAAKNPDCDLLMVDSHSPAWDLVADDFAGWTVCRGDADGLVPGKRIVYDFGNNIGHLSRNGDPRKARRDGWGRATMWGLDWGAKHYDYVFHIEGDSLFRLPVMPIAREMKARSLRAVSTPVEGTRKKEIDWIETGLMGFDSSYLRSSELTRKYNWPDPNKPFPRTPEWVLRTLIGDDLTFMPWKAERADKTEIAARWAELDWITHSWKDLAPYKQFVSSAMGESEPVVVDNSKKKINLGCGKNRLDGWDNYDREVDISRPLRLFQTETADFMFGEHVMEHVSYHQAVRFLMECRRVLKAGGVLRIVVPSLVQIRRATDERYFEFTEKWQKIGANARGACNAIIFAHGHQMAWSAEILEATLFAVGFDTIKQCELNESEHPELRGVEGHHKVIGHVFNAIESCVLEASWSN